jgi:hypothetical protein
MNERKVISTFEGLQARQMLSLNADAVQAKRFRESALHTNAQSHERVSATFSSHATQNPMEILK